MTNPDLAALSAAATQGKWTTETEAGDEWWFGNGDGMETVVLGPEEKVLAVMGGADNPNFAFIVALVNAYRTGDIVQIDREGMRERVVAALEGVLHGWCLGERPTSDLADAAIDAILGGE